MKTHSDVKAEFIKWLDINIERESLSFQLVKGSSPEEVKGINELMKYKGKPEFPTNPVVIQNQIKRLKALRSAVIKLGISDKGHMRILKKNNPTLNRDIAMENFRAFIKKAPSKTIPVITGVKA